MQHIKSETVVLSGPSGVGKGALLKDVLRMAPNFSLPISHTTRSPRKGEEDGREYHFTTRPVFEEMISNDLFVEYAEVHGNLYGTSWLSLLAARKGNNPVILEIDYQGAVKIRQRTPEAALVFLLPPSKEELERRIRERGKDSEEQIVRRLAAAREELSAIRHFHYWIENRTLARATREFRDLVDILGVGEKPDPFVYANKGVLGGVLSTFGLDLSPST